MECLDSGSPLCVICQNEFDQKPVVAGNGGIEERRILEDLQRRRRLLIEEVAAALGVFTKLLRSGGENTLVGGAIRMEFGDDEKDEEEQSKEMCEEFTTWTGGGDFPPTPCCEDCCGGLISILRLEEEIKRNLAKQLKHVQMLKDALICSLSGTDKIQRRSSWVKLRNRMIKCVGGSKEVKGDLRRAEKKMEVPKPFSQCSITDTIIPCSVVLERLGTDFRTKRGDSSGDGNERSQNHFEEGGCNNAKRVKEATEKARKRLGLMEEKDSTEKETANFPNGEDACETLLCLETFGNDYSDDEFQPPDDDNRLSDSASSDGDGEYTPAASQNKPKDKSKPKANNVEKKTDQGPASQNLFYAISNNFLLFKNTPIQFSNQGFTCCNLGCSLTIPGIEFESFQKLKAHCDEYHFKFLENKCPLCSTAIKAGTGLRKHITSCHRLNNAVCEICWKPMHENNMRIHLWSHKSAEERAEAVANGEQDPNKKKAEYQSKIGLKHQCQKCGLRFRWKTLLQQHENRHLIKESRRRCPHCPNLSFRKRVHLYFHLETKHNAPPKVTGVCHICNKRYISQFKLQDHLRTHTGEKPFQCEECGKRFTSKTLLNYHAAAHSSDKPFQCEYCTLAYKSKRGLKLHQQSKHKDLGLDDPVDPEYKLKSIPYERRPGFIGPKIAYPCEYCDKVFPQKSLRAKHVGYKHKDRLPLQDYLRIVH